MEVSNITDNGSVIKYECLIVRITVVLIYKRGKSAELATLVFIEWVGRYVGTATSGLSGNISQTQTPLVVFAGLSQSFFFPAAANSQPRFAGHIRRSIFLVL